MNEDFVSFELAKKLKEKGFPQTPEYYYTNYSSYYKWDGLRKIHSLSNASAWFDTNVSKDNLYFAPTISQVLKWLRDEKDIYVQIEYINNEYFGSVIIRRTTGGIVASYKYDKFHYSDDETLSHEKYEQTALAGIEYCLDKLDIIG